MSRVSAQKDYMRFFEKATKKISKAIRQFLFTQECFLVSKRQPSKNVSARTLLTRLKWFFHSVKESLFVAQEKPRTQTVIEAESLEEFLSSYSVSRKGSYGKAYLRRRRVVACIAACKKQVLFIGGLFRSLTWRAALMVFLLVVIYGVTPGALSAPQSVAIDTRAEWETGAQTNTTTLSSTDAIQLQSAGSWKERVWAPTKEPINAGHASVLVGNYLYATRGQSDKAFWRYDTVNNIWENLSDLPVPAYLGADMSYVSATGDIYMIFWGVLSQIL